jgi:hypothetical protein
VLGDTRLTKVFDTIASSLAHTPGFLGGAGLGVLYEYPANASPTAAVPRDELDVPVRVIGRDRGFGQAHRGGGNLSFN